MRQAGSTKAAELMLDARSRGRPTFTATAPRKRYSRQRILTETPSMKRTIAQSLVNLHSWVGINGVYDFRDGEQRRIGINSIGIDKWMPAQTRFIAMSKAGGSLK
jgi:hypothetical protein